MLRPTYTSCATKARLPRLNLLPSRRQIATQRWSTLAPEKRLAAQRLNRPISPHMSVYKWEYVSAVSALQRLTGIVLSGGLYLSATFYLISPYLDIHIDSTTLVDAFGSLHPITKATVKFLAVMPFTYHAFNGVKQLAMDSGRFLGKVQSGRASWIVLACSTCASLGLTFY